MNFMYAIAKALRQLETEDEVCKFLDELLTKSEIEALSKRWCILKMLTDGRKQREIAKDLHVSLCKVTRGARILKDENSLIPKLVGNYAI